MPSLQKWAESCDFFAAYLFHLRESSFSFLSLAQVVEALGEFEISEGQFVNSDALYSVLIGGDKRQ